VPIVLVGLLLSFLVMLLFGGTEFDRGLFMLIHARDGPDLAVAGMIAEQATRPLVLAAMAGAGSGLLVVRRQWRGALLLVAVAAGVLLLAGYLGGVTATLRPLPGERMAETQTSPFPNAAAAGAAAIWLSLAFLLTKHRPWRTIWAGLAVFLAIGVGTLQLLNGLAWPSDVIGGWALGLFWPLLLLWLGGVDLSDGEARAAARRE
jgi:undecaprenyl-diphosphatase